MGLGPIDLIQQLKEDGLDLGPATGQAVTLPSGMKYRDHQHGRIYYRDLIRGLVGIHTSILQPYLANGGHDETQQAHKRTLGLPISSSIPIRPGGHMSASFERGLIYVPPGQPARVVIGDLAAAYRGRGGGQLGQLGYPVSSNVTIGDGEAFYCEGGCVWRDRDFRSRDALCGFLALPTLGHPLMLPPDGRGTFVIGRVEYLVDEGNYARMRTSRHTDTWRDLWTGRLILKRVGDPADRHVLDIMPNNASSQPNKTLKVTCEVVLPPSAKLHERGLYNIEILVGQGRSVPTSVHAVYAKSDWTNFGFMHATDIHVSERLDGFRRILQAAGRTEAAEHYNNFNDAFRDVIRYANVLYRKGVLDLIIMTGDVIDYVHEKNHTPGAGGNFALLKAMLLGLSPYPDRPAGNEPPEELLVPTFITPGNHDYRLYPYALGFDLDWHGKKLKSLRNYECFNLSKEDTKAIQKVTERAAWPEFDSDEAAAMADKTPSDPEGGWGRYYCRNFARETGYHERIGPHHLVMIDSAYDIGVVDDMWKWLNAKLTGDENAATFLGGSPNSHGIQPDDLSRLRQALVEAGSRNLVIVGIHAPPLNPAGNEYPAYFRETEHPTANPKDILDFLRRNGADSALDPSSSGLPHFIPDPTWTAQGTAYFKSGTVQNVLDQGISRGHTDEFLELCAGSNGRRPVDLVLCGHVHRRVDFRLGHDPAGAVTYFMDFYTENPPRYYAMEKYDTRTDSTERAIQVVKDRVQPNGLPYEVRDHRADATPPAWKEVFVPPYPEPLNSNPDPQTWWKTRRPLILQTAGCGPMESRQRPILPYIKDLPINELAHTIASESDRTMFRNLTQMVFTEDAVRWVEATADPAKLSALRRKHAWKPSPTFQGFRVARVAKNTIEKIHYVCIEELRRNKFVLDWEKHIPIQFEPIKPIRLFTPKVR
jgi:3',5'-cyclic AMP phosphodiesterase CpdA